MKDRCVIIAGSPICADIFLEKGDYIMACDNGYSHAKARGIVPNIVLGDFDSYVGKIERGIEILRAPTEKDDTDTMLAVKLALSRGYTRFLLLGATKGRLDHQMANFTVCAYIAECGAECIMIDDDSEVYAIKNRKITLKRRENWSVTVLSHSDKSVGVTLTGLKYPLNNATVTNTLPIGVSNEFAEDEATVQVESGVLFVILSSKENEIVF